MKKLHLLSRAEMKKVLGGNAPSFAECKITNVSGNSILIATTTSETGGYSG